jgi:hypothetical protein
MNGAAVLVVCLEYALLRHQVFPLQRFANPSFQPQLLLRFTFIICRVNRRSRLNVAFLPRIGHFSRNWIREDAQGKLVTPLATLS